jgi:hypothetical protein
MGLFGRSRADQELIMKLEQRTIDDAKRIAELETRIATGHWRNPVTGRLGKKGETF